MRKFLMLSAASCVSLGGALAQPALADASAPPTGLETIVVTAQRVSQDAQKAAVALDVVSAPDLTKNNITEPTGLGFLVPALTPTPNGFFMRGVGNFAPNVLADPAIAFNYDDAYVARPLSTSGFFFDLQRIEVLKGPQGTLYGRNATGGAINVIPIAPQTDATSAYVDADFGTYDTYGVQGAVNVAIDDQTAVRASGDVIGHSAYNADGTSDESTRAARFQVLHDFSPDLSIKIGADYEYVGGVGGGTGYVNRYLPPAACAVVAGCTYSGNNFTVVPSGLALNLGSYSAAEQAYRQTLPAGPAGRTLNPLADTPYQNNNEYGLNADIEYHTAIGDVTILPSWRHSSNNSVTPAPGFDTLLISPDEQHSVEARFQSREIGMFDFSVGGMYFHETNSAHYSVNQMALEAYVDATQNTDSYAGFARVTANITDALRVVGGIRYTDDEKSYVANTTNLAIVCSHIVATVPNCSGANGDLLPEVPLLTTTATLAQQQALGIFPVIASGGAPAPIFVPGPGPGPGHVATGAIEQRSDLVQNNSLSNGRATYRGALEYDVTPTSLAYASVETGFHSGGFGNAVGYETYQPEYITAYTIGSKNRFFDNTLQLNAEAFIWDYRNQQISHQGIDMTGKQGNITQNIGSSTNQGGEVDGHWLATDTTVLSTDIQYLDATYNSFTYVAPAVNNLPAATGCSQVLVPYVGPPPILGHSTVNCSGKQALNSPKWTVNLGIEQTIPFDDFALVGEIDTQYKSSRFIGFEYLAAQRQAPTWQTNAELTLTPNAGVWSAQVFATNLENDRYKINSTYYAQAGVLLAGTAAPRTVGLRLTYQY